MRTLWRDEVDKRAALAAEIERSLPPRVTPSVALAGLRRLSDRTTLPHRIGRSAHEQMQASAEQEPPANPWSAQYLAQSSGSHAHAQPVLTHSATKGATHRLVHWLGSQSGTQTQLPSMQVPAPPLQVLVHAAASQAQMQAGWPSSVPHEAVCPDGQIMDPHSVPQVPTQVQAFGVPPHNAMPPFGQVTIWQLASSQLLHSHAGPLHSPPHVAVQAAASQGSVQMQRPDAHEPALPMPEQAASQSDGLHSVHAQVA